MGLFTGLNFWFPQNNLKIGGTELFKRTPSEGKKLVRLYGNVYRSCASRQRKNQNLKIAEK